MPISKWLEPLQERKAPFRKSVKIRIAGADRPSLTPRTILFYDVKGGAGGGIGRLAHADIGQIFDRKIKPGSNSNFDGNSMPSRLP